MLQGRLILSIWDYKNLHYKQTKKKRAPQGGSLEIGLASYMSSTKTHLMHAPSGNWND